MTNSYTKTEEQSIPKKLSMLGMLLNLVQTKIENIKDMAVAKTGKSKNIPKKLRMLGMLLNLVQTEIKNIKDISVEQSKLELNQSEKLSFCQAQLNDLEDHFKKQEIELSICKDAINKTTGAAATASDLDVSSSLKESIVSSAQDDNLGCLQPSFTVAGAALGALSAVGANAVFPRANPVESAMLFLTFTLAGASWGNFLAKKREEEGKICIATKKEKEEIATTHSGYSPRKP